MHTMNTADIVALVFLGFGILDGFRKGLVKKGMMFLASLLTLAVVYMASPYVAAFFRTVLPSVFSLETILNTDSELYRMLALSGLGDRAESGLYLLASRVLAVAVTYFLVKLFLRTVVFSLELLTKVPGLSLMNRLLGAALGLAQQLLVVWLILLVIAVFSATGWGSACYDFIHGGICLSYLYENNPLLLVGILLTLKF